MTGSAKQSTAREDRIAWSPTILAMTGVDVAVPRHLATALHSLFD
jgi:hypothetical protein